LWRYNNVNMPKKKNKQIQNKTAQAVVNGILSKKGNQIAVMSLEKIPNSVAAYYIICHGTSSTHTKAISKAVEEYTKNETGFNPLTKEGTENAEWILIDYADVVVHIFQETSRNHYKLEELWADAEIQHIEDLD
jgi:ribosome-associated protein